MNKPISRPGRPSAEPNADLTQAQLDEKLAGVEVDPEGDTAPPDATTSAAVDTAEVAAENAPIVAKHAPKAPEAATRVKRTPFPKSRLKSVKWDRITDPTNGVTVDASGTPNKVEVSTWMQAQIEAGLIAVVQD